jgi:hypothetical protein
LQVMTTLHVSPRQTSIPEGLKPRAACAKLRP